MFVIDRTRGGTDEVPEEIIDMAGTTGNIYSITIAQLPSCTCPDHQKGNQCKHVVYVSSLSARHAASLADIVKGVAQRPQSSRTSTVPIGLLIICM